ncbi:MAG TPA: glycosyltransferase family 39 protein [Crinalium sp.]
MLLQPKPHWSNLRQASLTLLAPVLLIAIAFLKVPIYDTFEFDNDEGINLMKAFLYWKGFSLYSDIWSDQPPLLTFIVANWFKLFGPSVVATRLLILVFTALLVWTFQRVLQMSVGTIPAWIGTLFLIASWSFLKLSVAVMIGLPSLALAMLSIYILLLYKNKPHWSLLGLSGGLLALSMQIKLFTVVLVPLLILALFDFRFKSRQRDGGERAIASALLWVGSLVAVYVVIGLLFNSLNYDQLLASHMQESIKETYDETRGFRYFLFIIVHDADFVFLSLLGAAVVVQQKRWDGLLPLTWLATATLLLITHRPIWYHHYPLMSIPMIWLAMYSVLPVIDFVQHAKQSSNGNIFSFNRLKQKPLIALTLFLLVISIGLMPVKLVGPIRRPTPQWEIVDLLKKYSAHTRWVFSDRPIIPFYAQLPVPPNIAVLSQKRFASGAFTYDDVLDTLKTYAPEQIVLARKAKDIKSNPKIHRFLAANYTRMYSKAYSRRDKDAVAEHYLIKSYPQ